MLGRSAFVVGGAAAPFELGAHDGEVAVVAALHQAQAVGRERDLDARVGRRGGQGAAIGGDDQTGGGVGAVEHPQAHAGAKDDGAVAQGVRADGRHRQHLGRGVDERAAGGEVVGGGAGGRAEDEAVAEVVGDELVVGEDLEADRRDALWTAKSVGPG